VEGSHDGVSNTLLPKDMVVEHDYTQGPYWPIELFDATWSVEFIEHVGRQYMDNWLATMRRSALVFMTGSAFGGWHHSEIRPSWWWVARMERSGFRYSADLTSIIRGNAQAERKRMQRASEGAHLQVVGQYISTNMMVFINTNIAHMKRFDHLFAGHGCKWEQDMVECDERFKWYNKDVDRPPKEFESLLNCRHFPAQDGAKNSQRQREWIHGPWDCSPNEGVAPS
jgi:hypothetical protein